MWAPSDRTADAGLAGSAASMQHRLDEAAERAHARALDSARLRRSTDVMRALGARDVGDLVAAVADAEARAAAAEQELDRLRALPELKVGQRVRQPAAVFSRRRQSPPPVPAASVEAVVRAEAAPVAALILVRNRRRSLDDMIAWLRAAGIGRIEIVDNATSDPLTLNALERSEVPVHRLEEDLGDAAPWAVGALADPLLDGPVVLVGDDTVITDQAPALLVDHLLALLDAVVDADALDLVSSGPPGRVAWIRVIRRGAGPRGERHTVNEPWVALASLDADPEDPEERYARMHEADRPRSGPIGE
ncbi:MAG: hypothetical protein AAGF73_03375 [Actinomycetota bacterium]